MSESGKFKAVGGSEEHERRDQVTEIWTAINLGRERTHEISNEMVSLKEKMTMLAEYRSDRDKLLIKLEEMGKQFNAFLLQNATQIQEFANSIKAMHRRQDQHEKDHEGRAKWVMGIIGSVVGTAILALGGFLLGLFRKS